MDPNNQQQYGYPPPAAGYGYPPPAAPPGQYSAPPPGYPQGGYPPQGPPGGYPPYPPPMGVAGMPPGMGRPPPPQPYQQKPPQQQYTNKPPGFDVEAQQAATYAAAFAEKKVRAAFVRKVFILVALQLAFTVGIAAIFMFVTPVNEYVAGKKVCTTNRQGEESCYRLAADGQWVFYTSWALTLVTMIALMCSSTLRRKFPWNYVAMIALTLVLSVQVGCIVAWWDLAVVLEAVAVTGAAVLGLTLFAIFVPWDITKRGHIIAMASVVVFFIAIVTIIVGIFYYNKWWYLAISAVFAVMFSVYLVYDIQMILGNKSVAASPDDFCFCAVQLYLDIVFLFLQILSIIGIAQS